MNANWHFDTASEVAQEQIGNSYHPPSSRDLKRLRIGDQIRLRVRKGSHLSFSGSEAFWAKIHKWAGIRKVEVIIESDLSSSRYHDLHYGDIIEVDYDNILIIEAQPRD